MAIRQCVFWAITGIATFIFNPDADPVFGVVQLAISVVWLVAYHLEQVIKGRR